MWRRIFRWIAPLLIAGICYLPAANAQGAPPSAAANEDSGKTPALQYTVAFLAIILVMVVVCTPSRKR